MRTPIILPPLTRMESDALGLVLMGEFVADFAISFRAPSFGTVLAKPDTSANILTMGGRRYLVPPAVDDVTDDADAQPCEGEWDSEGRPCCDGDDVQHVTARTPDGETIRVRWCRDCRDIAWCAGYGIVGEVVA